MDATTKYAIERDKQTVIENRRTSAMQFARDTMGFMDPGDRSCGALIANAAAIESYLQTGKSPKTKKAK